MAIPTTIVDRNSQILDLGANIYIYNNASQFIELYTFEL